MYLRKITILAAVAAALAVPAQATAKSPSAQDGVYVCNSAHANDNGTLNVLDIDLQGGLKADSGLTAMGGGNVNAAAHSRALALCGLPADPPVDGPPVVMVGT